MFGFGGEIGFYLYLTHLLHNYLDGGKKEDDVRDKENKKRAGGVELDGSHVRIGFFQDLNVFDVDYFTRSISGIGAVGTGSS